MATNNKLKSSQLDEIYRDMSARIDMGLVDLETGAAGVYMQNLWESITEKIGEDFDCPEDSTMLNIYSVVVGAVTERIMRERYPEEEGGWW